MSVSFRAAADTSDGGSATCNKPTGTASGDLLVGWVASYNTTSITGPSGWTKQADVNDGNSQLSVWTKTAGSSEPTSYSWGGGSGYFDSCIQSFFSSTGKTLQLDGVPANVKQTTESSPSMTATNANEALAVCWMTDANNGSGSGTTSATNSVTVDTGTAAVNSSHADGFGAGHKLLTASGATGAVSWSNLGNTSTAGIGMSLVVQEQSSGTPHNLSATVPPLAGLSATLVASKPLSASVPPLAGLSATLTVGKPLAATVPPLAGLSAVLTVTKALHASVPPLGGLGATLTVAKPLRATVPPLAGLSATLSVTKALHAAVPPLAGPYATLTAGSQQVIPPPQYFPHHRFGRIV